MPEATASAWRSLSGRSVEPGDAEGMPLLLNAPLSFWGGYDTQRGQIIEPAHPNAGAELAGRVVLMARAKGSSSSSSVLAEALREGTGPVAMVMCESDLIVALGAIVARELYGVVMPLIVVDPSIWRQLETVSDRLRISARADGTATIEWGKRD